MRVHLFYYENNENKIIYFKCIDTDCISSAKTDNSIMNDTDLCKVCTACDMKKYSISKYPIIITWLTYLTTVGYTSVVSRIKVPHPTPTPILEIMANIFTNKPFISRSTSIKC